MHIESSVTAFDELCACAQACRRCARMEGRRRVLSAANGRVNARVLFVAEAPGRLGAELGGKPLYGDRAGRNFEMLLAAANLARDDVFITNAVLCNPQDARGLNARPTSSEIANCSAHLADTIRIIDAHVVAALGRVALAALHLIEQHEVGRTMEFGVATGWHGRLLVPLCHPSGRAMATRPLAKQLEDYKKLGEIVRRVG